MSDDESTAVRRRVVDPVLDFLHDEAIGGVVLVVAAVVAVAWANVGTGYASFWHRELTLGSGTWALHEDYRDWVNDGLMTVFFFVVGIEIKRELVVGELRGVRAAALPAIAALGGVLVPIVLFLVIVGGGDASRGWGVPMATDIAFAVGVLSLIGRRATQGSKLYLLSVAVVDDVLAIIVIAIFYSTHLSLPWLLVAVATVALIVAMRRFATSPWWYVVPAFVLWFATFESGVHATLAGVALGLLTPAGLFHGRPVLAGLEHRLHPISVFVVVPIFALANAGVDLGGGAVRDAFDRPVTWAIVVGLVIGKLVGISGATFLALRLRAGVLPAGMRKAEIVPVAALGGIGFTVALFIADLAFADPITEVDAKVGIFAASIAAVIVGGVLLRLVPAVGSRLQGPDRDM